MLDFPNAEDLTFQPEGVEDLAVYSDGKLRRVVQIKSGDNLSLSSFSPHSPSSFFYRAATHMVGSSPDILIVSFGAVGPELAQAFSGVDAAQRRVAKKLAEVGPISYDLALETISKVKLEVVDEQNLLERVLALLGESIAGIDTESAFELLTARMYRCAEDRHILSRAHILEAVQRAGKFLSERHAHHREWFTSIVPIEDRVIDFNSRALLATDFYQGISATFDHILSGADVKRPGKLAELHQAFTKSSVVIVHGASGQGKTSLCYRYIHEHFPDTLRYQVQVVEDRSQAVSIARAISGYVENIGVRTVVYIDVKSSDSGWPELTKALSGIPYLDVLVSIREEDWQRSNISGSEFKFAEMVLTLTSDEAELLYGRLITVQQPSHLISFEDAWTKFGGDGPLLEFVYLVTHGGLLRERLAAQIKRIEDEARTNSISADELTLLRIVSLASSYEARIRLDKLIAALSLPAPSRTLQLFENEYLIRRTNDGMFVQGLHPIRSALLTDILSDPAAASWDHTASLCLPLIDEPDLEVFLLFALARHTILPHLFAALGTFQPETWLGIVSIINALIWHGVAVYVRVNEPVIRDAFAVK